MKRTENVCGIKRLSDKGTMLGSVVWNKKVKGAITEKIRLYLQNKNGTRMKDITV